MCTVSLQLYEEQLANACTCADGNDMITESNLVAEYLDHKYADAGPKLFPTDALKLFKACTVDGSCSDKLQTSTFARPTDWNMLIGALVCRDLSTILQCQAVCSARS